MTQEGEKDMYFAMADAWTWAMSDLAWNAHIAGDDPLALATTRLLVRAWDAIEPELKRRGFKLDLKQAKIYSSRYAKC